MLARLLVLLLGVWMWTAVPTFVIGAEDDSPSNTATEDSADADSEMADEDADDADAEDANDEDETANEIDPYAIPEGTNKELLEHLETIRRMRPRGENRAEMIESFKKAGVAMSAVADKILANQPSDEEKATAIEVKFDALERLGQLNHEGTRDELLKFSEQLKADGNEELQKRIQSMLLQLRVRKLMMGDTDGAKELLDEVTAQLKADPDNTSAVKLAMAVGQALEYSGKTNDLAIQAYRDFSDIMSKSTNADVQRYAEQLSGVVRRLELVGNSMEISGTLLDGKPFDPDTLKGKVVLVDFWATWCGPCIAELPNVQNNYEKYHNKGFEVIGISLDNEREALETFVKDRELPWPILYEEGKESGGWANPMAKKYGIMGIPTVILIGADGKVVSLNARGGKLGKLLEELLGPAEVGDKAEANQEAGESADSN